MSWVHQDPVTKSQRITNSSGAVTSTIDLDPWGGETSRSSNQAFQPHRYTTYERDANGGDEAMMRRYVGKWHRFVQPDPADGSYDLSNPQSFNRYAYVLNDPVSFVDPTGLDQEDWQSFNCITRQDLGTGVLDWAFGWQGPCGGGGGAAGVEGRGGGGGGGPQNPIPVPLASTDAIKNRLNTDDCNAFIATLIAKLNELYGGKGNIPIAKDGLDLLSKISSQGGFVMKNFLKMDGWPIAGTVSGSIAGGTATVLISTRFMFGSSASTIAMWQADYISTAIHEMLHLSAKYSGYDDRALATAASKLPGAAPGLTAPPKDYKDVKAILANSSYFDSELKKHCGGNRK